MSLPIGTIVLSAAPSLPEDGEWAYANGGTLPGPSTITSGEGVASHGDDPYAKYVAIVGTRALPYVNPAPLIPPIDGQLADGSEYEPALNPTTNYIVKVR